MNSHRLSLRSLMFGFCFTFVASLALTCSTPAGSAPVLQVTPTSVTGWVEQGQNAWSGRFEVRNAGDGTLSYMILRTNDWLLTAATNGTADVMTNVHQAIFFSTNLSPAVYNSSLTVNAGASGTQTVQVTLTVTNTVNWPRLTVQAALEDGIRLTNGNSSPYPYRLTNGNVRLYYNGLGGIASAVSTDDGVSFAEESGTRMLGGDATVIPTSNNCVRMYFKRPTTNELGWSIDRVYSALSSNGLDFQDEGLRFQPVSGGSWYGTNFTSSASVPEAVVLSNGWVRLFYASNKKSVTDAVGAGGIGASISSDGLDFLDEAGARADVVGFVDPAVVRLTNGYYMMLTANPHDPSSPKTRANELANGIYGYLSRDGSNFFHRQPVMVATSGANNVISRATDPGILWVTGDVYRVYFADPYGDQDVRSFLMTATVVAAPTNAPTLAANALTGDIDGDRLSDLAVYDEANGQWFIKLSTQGYNLTTLAFGGNGQTALLADFDGDAKADPTIYVRATGQWQVKLSRSGYQTATLDGFGGTGFTPLAADFDADSQADPAIFAPATGTWSVKLSGAGYATASAVLGDTHSTPLALEVDGDRRADVMVYQGDSGNWYVLLSAQAYLLGSILGFGGADYAPVVADFDGDGLSDPGIYAGASGGWQVKLSGQGYATAGLNGFGSASDQALATDYDGDGKADPAIFAPTTGTLTVKLSSQGYTAVTVATGYTP